MLRPAVAAPLFFLLVTLSTLYLHLKIYTLADDKQNVNLNAQKAMQIDLRKLQQAALAQDALFKQLLTKQEECERAIQRIDQLSTNTINNDDDTALEMGTSTVDRIAALEAAIKSLQHDEIKSTVEAAIRSSADKVVVDSFGAANSSLLRAIESMEELMDQWDETITLENKVGGNAGTGGSTDGSVSVASDASSKESTDDKNALSERSLRTGAGAAGEADASHENALQAEGIEESKTADEVAMKSGGSDNEQE